VEYSLHSLGSEPNIKAYMSLVKRIIELNRDIMTFDERYGIAITDKEKEKKQALRVKKLKERRKLINFFKQEIPNEEK